MKKLYFFLLFPFLLNAQNGFQQKMKPKSTGATKEKTLELKDGQKLEKNLRLADTKLISFKIAQNEIKRDEQGNVVFIEVPEKLQDNKNARKGLLTESYEFLTDIKDILEVKNPAKEFELVEQQTDERGRAHLKFRQVYQNIVIYGSEVILHENDNQIKTMNGRSFKSSTLKDVSPAIDAEAAKSVAFSDVKQKSIVQQDAFAKSIIKKQEQSAELIIYHDKNKVEYLAWHLTIKPNVLERWVYFIDAKSGKILDKYNNTCTLDGTIKASARDLNGITKAFNVYQKGSQFMMIDTERPMFKSGLSVLPDEPVGAIWTIDALNTAGEKFDQISSSSANMWSDKAVSAHVNAGIAYDYYRIKHSRNSLNNKGGNIVSVINIADDDGRGMDNAYWNGEFMGYGNGRSAFKPLAGSLDVAGHEMTHGVVENSAKLEYRTQSGAINESIADVFGVLIENSNNAAGQAINWTLGETVVKATAFPSGALRSLSNPNQGGIKDPGYQPKTMGQYVFLDDTPEEDNGGVHVNSGIPNYAFYLFASNPNVGLDNAGKVYYKALTTYLTRQSQFLDLRLAVVQAAKDVFPSNAGIATAANEAFDKVGIGSGSSTGGGNTGGGTTSQPKPDVQVNPGTEFAVIFEPSSKQLYIHQANTNQFAVISTKGLRSRPSVTDNGTAVYFVGEDKNIYKIENPTSGSRKEFKLTSSGEFDNVAVSKDGNRLAALRVEEDKTIYVFDLMVAGGKAQPFKLYNPTYSTGVQTGEVLYADSFEWDYSGENIIYDAYNQLKSSTGQNDINYWDVGLIKVWDLAKNTFAAGTIQKIFSDLEEGDNIGNPSFSKTSPDVLVFDYFSSKVDTKTYKILGVDLYKNKIETIAESNDIGFPNYTKNDKVVSFNTKNGERQDVSSVSINTDKITPTTTKNTMFTDANWAVWFAFGQRALPTKVNQTISSITIPNQKKGAKVTLSATATSKLPVQYRVFSGDAVIEGNTITCGNTVGKVVVKAYQPGNAEFNATSIEVSFNIVEDVVAVKQNQTISLTQIADQFAGSSIILKVSSTSNLPVTIAVVAGDATVGDGVLTCGSRVGTVTLRASQAGNADFNAAATIDMSFKIIAKSTVLSTQSNEAEMVFYPNPTNDEVFIKEENGLKINKLTLISAKGELLKTTDKNEIISLKHLPSGQYHLQADTNRGVISRKIIKD